MSHIGFNTSDYGGFNERKTNIVFPAGDYVMLIISDEFKHAKSGKGNGFLFEFQICEGQYSGTIVKHWINYEHQNKTTEDIGRAELEAIANACGLINPKETERLYNTPMLVTLEVEYKTNPNTGEEIPDNNRFVKYKRLGETGRDTLQPAPPQPHNSEQPTALQSANNTRLQEEKPWM